MGPSDARAPLASSAQRLGYKVAVFAVFLQFAVSPNVLALLGIALAGMNEYERAKFASWMILAPS